MNKEQETYIIENFGSMSVEALRNRFNEIFGTTYKTTAFHYHTKRLGLGKHIEHQYTKEEDNFLRENSPLMSRKDLASAFNERFGTNIKAQTINVRCCLKGWAASDNGQFKKGSVPWEKSVSKEYFLSRRKAAGNAHTFPKGHIPHNTRPIGAERISCKGELLVKTDDGWKAKRQLTWEENYGEIPKGMRVISVNGDINDTNIQNLRLIDNNTQLMLMTNNWNKSGSEIFDAGVMYAKLYFLLKEQMGLNHWDFRT